MNSHLMKIFIIWLNWNYFGMLQKRNWPLEHCVNNKYDNKNM